MDVSSWSEEKVKKELRKKGWQDFSAGLPELREILTALMDDDDDVIPDDRSGFASNGGMTEDDALIAAIEESKSQAEPQVQNNFVNPVPIPPAPTPFDLARIRRPPTRIEIAKSMGITEANLNQLWGARVAGLSRFENLERNRYTQEIQRAASELPSFSSGVTIAVILPHGNRITKVWDPNENASGVYVWCAADDKMAKNVIRLGTFVIINTKGEILDPNAKIGDQVSSQATLFNAWLL